MNYWQMIAMGSAIAGWLMRASADGKIDERELVELVRVLAESSGIKLSLDLPVAPPSPGVMGTGPHVSGGTGDMTREQMLREYERGQVTAARAEAAGAFTREVRTRPEGSPL